MWSIAAKRKKKNKVFKDEIWVKAEIDWMQWLKKKYY